MNSDWIEREVEDCISELQNICEHFAPTPSRWHKIKRWRFRCWPDDPDAPIVAAFWIILLGGMAVLSKCDTKRWSQTQKSLTAAQYTLTDHADGTQDVAEDESEEVSDQE